MTPSDEGPEAEPSSFDVAFVGMGVSNTFTVIELLARLELQNARFARVLLIDKNADFFKGIPYGERSGDLGLIISRLADFLPDTHSQPFAEWLAINREQAFERFFALGGTCVEEWRGKFWRQVEEGDIADLYLPRYVLGLYFEHIATRAIEHARAQGVASCERIVGEVVDLDRAGGGFNVLVRDQSGAEVNCQAGRVVLGLGSAPSKRILEPRSEAWRIPPGCVLIHDPFEPGIADMLERIRSAAQRLPGSKGRVLVIGSNAGALDVLFNLMNDRSIAAAISRIEVLSMSGKWPEQFSFRPVGSTPSFECRALGELASRESIFADDIFEAVRQDIDSARQQGLTITDTFVDIATGFNALLNRLSLQEKLRFACQTGTRIGTLQRRVGKDYWDVTSDLMRQGRLVVKRSRFPVGAASSDGEPHSIAMDDGGPGADDPESGAEPLLAIVNCSGSSRLSSLRSNPALLCALIDRGWLRPTGSDFGVCVNDDLETDTPRLYAMGPMLTGNVVRGEPLWNLEHCGRIARFARLLAAHLVHCGFAEKPQ